MIGIMHYNDRIHYLIGQARASDSCPLSICHTHRNSHSQIMECRCYYRPYFLTKVMPRQEGEWPGFYCGSMVQCEGER